jgi:hypothetical protein
MNGEVGNGKTETDIEEDDVDFAASPDDTVVITEDIDDLDTDTSAEYNVDELVAKIDKQSDEHKKEVKRRLEELEERKRAERDLDSTYNFNLDDEL